MVPCRTYGRLRATRQALPQRGPVSTRPPASSDQRNWQRGIWWSRPVLLPLCRQGERPAVTPLQPELVAAPLTASGCQDPQDSWGPQRLPASCFTVRLFGLNKLKGRCKNERIGRAQKKNTTGMFYSAVLTTP